MYSLGNKPRRPQVNYFFGITPGAVPDSPSEVYINLHSLRFAAQLLEGFSMAVFYTEAILLFAFIAYLLSGAQSALYLGDNWQKTEETRLLLLAFFGGNF